MAQWPRVVGAPQSRVSAEYVAGLVDARQLCQTRCSTARLLSFTTISTDYRDEKRLTMNRAPQIFSLIRIFLFLTVIFGFCVARAETEISNQNLNGTVWRPLRIGAGGYVTGLDISADGSTRVVRTDTYGAYIWDDQASKWTQLVTTSSMPQDDIRIDNSSGVYEIRVAPNLPARLYMTYQGYIYRSDDRGSHWTRTTFTNTPLNPNDSFRARGQKMAVDPANPNVVYVGTSQKGLFGTMDGGATWHSVSAVPVSQTDNDGNSPGFSGIEFDPALGVADGRTKAIFAASYRNGVYESTNGGTSWSSIGGPTDVSYATVSSTGVYYVAANGNQVWGYSNGAWTKLLDAGGGGIHSVAINPFNPSEIVAQNFDGNLAISYDGGVTWGGLNIGLNQLNSTDIPWLASSGKFMTIGGTAFDPLVPNKLFASAGVGVWNTFLPTAKFSWTTVVTWNDQSVGIEQLVANQVIAPPGGKPVLASWDRPFFYVDNPSAFPSTYGPVNGSFAMGWSLDYASSDPSFLVGIANWWGTELSGYSTDGGRTWSHFASYPPTNGKIGGSIAASTSTNFVWSPSNNAPPYYTNDGGATWIQILIDGVPAIGETGWGWAYYTNRHIVAADRVVAGTFYIYNYLRGLYRSTDGGATWILVQHGEISPWSGFGARLQSVPGYAGHLFFTSGLQGGAGAHPATNPFMHSIDGGTTWTPVSNVLEVRAFGFGRALNNYPTIFIVGWVNRTYGIWQSDDHAQSWHKIGDFPLGSLDGVTTIEGDKNVYGTVYIGFGGSGYAYGSLSK
jgi:hypothetical protein